MITPSAILPTSAACAAVPIPKPTATGVSRASALVAATSSASSAGSSPRSPVVPTVETT